MDRLTPRIIPAPIRTYGNVPSNIAIIDIVTAMHIRSFQYFNFRVNAGIVFINFDLSKVEVAGVAWSVYQRIFILIIITLNVY